MTEPDLAILITAANRCVADRLGQAVATAGGEAMRPSFGFVLRAVAAEQPTVSRLAELLGISKQGASRLADDMWTSPGFVESGCCCRRSCAQPKVVHRFSRAPALVRARPSGSPAAWSASYSAGERIPSVECSRVGL